MSAAVVHLGYEVGGGAPVSVPVQHLAVTGQTQMSGKTTTLEALVARSGLSAIAFVTKRGEGSFTTGHPVAPYFSERADWRFVSAVLEATLRERLKFERSWIMRACKGAETLGEVQENVQELLVTAKGMSADVYLTLDHYLDIVVPQIERLPATERLSLRSGLNVMDLSAYTTELQALVIRSVLEWVYAHGRGTLTIIPEAWEFIPQNRGSPVLLACEELIRKGGNLKNFVWLDSQDIAGVHKNILRQVGVWILGVQREANEVKRALAHIPGNVRKPKVDDIMELERGQFFACFGKTVVKVYVQPAWMEADQAIAIARGTASIDHVHKAERTPVPEAFAKARAEQLAGWPDRSMKEDEVDKAEADALRGENKRLKDEVGGLRETIVKMEKQIARLSGKAAPPALSTPAPVGNAGGAIDMDAIYAEVKRRAAADPGVLALLRERPELKVTVERRVIEATDQTLYGKLAAFIAEGFFDEPKAGNAAFVELQRRGQSTAKPNVYRECDKLASQGFLTKEDGGYQAVKTMKVNIVERREAA